MVLALGKKKRKTMRCTRRWLGLRLRWRDGRLARSPLTRLFKLSLEGMFGAVAGLGGIAIGAVLHRVGVAMPKLVFHGVVAALRAFVGFLGTLPAIGIIVQMVADTLRHGRPCLRACFVKNNYRTRLRRKGTTGNDRHHRHLPRCLHMSIRGQVIVMVTMGKINIRLTCS